MKRFDLSDLSGRFTRNARRGAGLQRFGGACILAAASLLGLGVGLRPAQAASFVFENPYEFTATGDFDGDGREDVVVVDRATGNYRIAHQPAPGQQVWASTRASGVENVAGFGVGHLTVATRDALAFTAPDANRVNLFDADSPTVAGLPIPVYVPTIGPSLALAIDIGGAGNTALDDLVVGSIDNNGGAPNQVSLMRNTAAVFAQIGASSALASPVSAGNAILLKTGTARMAGVILRAAGGDTFRAYNLAGGTLATALQLASLPANTLYVHANFSGTPMAQFLFYQPGETNGALRLRSVLEPVPGTYSFSAETVFNLGSAVQQVFTLAQPGGIKLLVLLADGQMARVYNFDGVSAPTLAQELTPANGEHFTGVAPFAAGDFTMLSAPAGATTSSRFQKYNRNGSQYVAGAAGNLPTLSALSGLANVFQFETEPFVSGQPHLLRTLNAGDWTTKFNVDALPQLSATVESFVSPSNGLDNPTPVALGTAHPLMHFGLVNQYAAPLSLFSLAAPMATRSSRSKSRPPPASIRPAFR